MYDVEHKDRLVAEARQAGRPTTGPTAEAIWRFSNVATAPLAVSLLEEAGYQIWQGYPLKRRADYRPLSGGYKPTTR